MRIVAISREFGSGGRELGKRMADILGFDYYDREIVSAVAAESGQDADYVKQLLEERGWENSSLSFRRSIGAPFYAQAESVKLLLDQKTVLENIAALGRDCVIVGRNADVVLNEYRPFSIFVCADEKAKLRRCMERAGHDEQLTEAQLLKQMRRIDKMRARTREIICGLPWGDRSSCDLIINTTNWDMKALSGAAADFVCSYWRENT